MKNSPLNSRTAVIYMQQNIICRPLRSEDDRGQVARLVYETDEYIFPYLYDNNILAAEKVISKMILRNTVYHYKNISVALEEDKIAGIIVSLPTPIKTDPAEMERSFSEAGVIAGDRFTRVYNEYYKLMEDEPDGIYIANVCVDSRYRRRGIAKALLEYFLSDHEVYRLDIVRANVGALQLYQQFGFEIEDSYIGFPDVPCYRMKRPAK